MTEREDQDRGRSRRLGRRGLTRRAVGGGLAGLALAATVAPRGIGRRAAAQDGAVYTLMEKAVADTGAGDATAIFNEERQGSPPIEIEEAVAGWDAKVLPAIRDNSLRWSGSGYVPYFEQFKHVKAGLVAPLADTLQASAIPWSTTQAEQYFTPRVYEALLLDGQQYFLPMKINVHMAGWRQDYLEAAGYGTMPATWDEVDAMLPQLKTALEAEEVIPFSIQRDLWRAIGSTFATFTEQTLDERGVFRFESPEWFDMIGLFKKWIDAGLARFDTNDIAVDAWQKGKFAMSLTSHSWVRLGRQVWGPEKVRGGIPPQANAGAPPRTWCHVDSGCVFNAAPDPQAATDWLLSIYGPEGAPAEAWYGGTLTFSGSPVHQSMIDKLVKPNPAIEEIEQVLGILPNSHITTVAQANGFNICQLRLAPYLDRYFSGELTAQDAMARLRVEVEAELAGQQV